MKRQSDDAQRKRAVEQASRLLMHLSWLAQKRFNQHISRYGITLPQFLALAYMIKERQCAMNQLAEATQQDAATMTGVVDRLERLNLVERRRNPLDRRVVFVIPTERALELVQEVYAAHNVLIAKLFESFEDDELQTLVSLLSRLLDSMHQDDYNATNGSSTDKA
ncbi:MarR family winged helix-turn-helix transcriptional regulator [Ardenticatena maritima]|nr:MarR family transcriptional regulator [Ardenticatena maritima]